MTESNQNGSQALTAEERMAVRKKIIRQSLLTRVGIPLIGTCLLIGLLVALSYILSESELEDNLLFKALLFACSVSLLWLIIGFFKHIFFYGSLPAKISSLKQ